MGIRGFVSVELPEELKAAIGQKTEALRNTGADVRWTVAENLHITLKFLGDTPDERLGEIESALREAVLGVKKFRARFGGLGVFPSQRRPRVIWVGLTAGEEDFRLLQARVERALAGLGFEPEGREFSAHLTLGRVRSPKGADSLFREFQKLEGEEFGMMEVGGLSLMKSDLSPKGSRYASLAEIGLEG